MDLVVGHCPPTQSWGLGVLESWSLGDEETRRARGLAPECPNFKKLWGTKQFEGSERACVVFAPGLYDSDGQGYCRSELHTVM
ncbi:hypothetical protein VTL71DRAFT_13616, partial [Oculimacula yallundae]